MEWFGGCLTVFVNSPSRLPWPKRIALRSSDNGSGTEHDVRTAAGFEQLLRRGGMTVGEESDSLVSLDLLIDCTRKN